MHVSKTNLSNILGIFDTGNPPEGFISIASLFPYRLNNSHKEGTSPFHP